MLKKFLLGTFVVAIMFVVALALTQKASAAPQAIVTVADVQYAATVRSGSSGQAALIWQNFLNGYSVTANLVADGKFGPLSEVQAKAWQASKGLVADGVLGPMSRAVAMAQIQSGSPASAFPAGCTSTVGYSSVTGLACYAVNANTFAPAGCTSASGFSPVNGGACYAVNANTLPAGCSSTAGYSPSTGAKCDGGSVSSNNNGPLTGGAGSIDVTKTSTDVSDNIIEGQNDTKVLGFKIQATDSDVSVTNIKLTFVHSGTGTSTFSKYANSVSLWMNGTKVGTANVSDFTKNGSEYSKSITLNNAIIRQGSSNRATFYVTVDGVSTIDSLNQGASVNWAVTADSIRFQDATGVVMSDSQYESNTVHVTDLATSGDVSLVLSKTTSNPITGPVMVSKTGSTSGVLMLEFKLKDTGTDITFDTVNVTLTGNVTGGSLADMLSELVLKNGSNEIASISDFSGATNTPCTTTSLDDRICTFQLDSSYTINADSTDTFGIYAVINSTNNFTGGSSLSVGLPIYDTDSTSGLNTQDVNGNPVEYTGSAIGELQYFASEGISASNFVGGTPTRTDNGSGVALNASFPITFKVTALSNDYYILKSGGLLATGATFSDLTASSNATSAGTYWQISSGDTVTFTTTGVIATPGAGFHSITLGTLAYSANGVNALTPYTFAPATSFQTPTIYTN